MILIYNKKKNESRHCHKNKEASSHPSFELLYFYSFKYSLQFFICLIKIDALIRDGKQK